MDTVDFICCGIKSNCARILALPSQFDPAEATKNNWWSWIASNRSVGPVAYLDIQKI